MQRVLDAFHKARKHATAFLAFLSIRFYGSEVSFQSVVNQKFSSPHKNVVSGDIGDPDLVLDFAKNRHKEAVSRRAVVSDKLKSLLTIGSFTLAVLGVLVPKGAFGSPWSRFGLYIGALMLLNMVVLLLASLEVREEMHVSLTEKDTSKKSSDLKQQLACDFLLCANDVDDGTDYLVEVYKAAKLFLSSGIWFSAVLLAIVYSSQPKNDPVAEFVSRLRGDPALVELLRGPKGERGEAASEEAVLGRLMKDPRFKGLVLEAMADSADKRQKENRPD